jgi:BolA family transcriptional regulator, general stress-responsive regulator
MNVSRWKPMNSLTYKERLRQKLEAALAPVDMEIIDDSARHRGHAGHDPRGETHFKVNIISAAFAGLAPVARHRLVYEAVAEELKERVHALNITAKTPEEIQP